MAKSTFHSSKRKSRLPMELTPSTYRRAQCRRVVHGPTTGPDVAGDAGGGLVVHDQHGLDGVCGVSRERVGDAIGRRRFVPLEIDDVGAQAESLGAVDEQMTELAEPHRQHAIARRERVHERGLPHRRAGGREDECVSRRCPEHALQISEERPWQLWKSRRAMVLLGAMHRAKHTVGNVGGTGNEEKMTAGHVRPARESGPASRRRARVWRAACRTRSAHIAFRLSHPAGKNSNRARWRRQFPLSSTWRT